MEEKRKGISGWLIAVGVFFVAIAISFGIGRIFYAPYYIPSQSMEPTFSIGDMFVVDKNAGRPPQVGDIVVVRRKTSVRIVRVAALAGDRVEMRDGVPIVNGVAVQQRHDANVVLITPEIDGSPGESVPAERLVEKLPRERGTHKILDIDHGYADGDNQPPVTVPAGRFFALGDNRDRAADSRFAEGPMGGLGTPPVSDIIGKAAFIYGTKDRSRLWTRPH